MGLYKLGIHLEASNEKNLTGGKQMKVNLLKSTGMWLVHQFKEAWTLGPVLAPLLFPLAFLLWLQVGCCDMATLYLGEAGKINSSFSSLTRGGRQGIRKWMLD